MKPKPVPRQKVLPDAKFPDLPNVPANLPDTPEEKKDDEIDFDDLSRRFEELKKRH
jgi:vacuolar protein sorting-associated protein IST1